jgi:Na+-driven multidrug efflux pump
MRDAEADENPDAVDISSADELRSAPVTKLVEKYSATTMGGMSAQIVMMVLEGFIVGVGFGSMGFACVSIVSSLSYINLALGNLFGTGAASVVGNLLGAGDREGAQHAFSQGFWGTLYVSVAVALVVELFTTQLALVFGATPDILEDSVAALRAFGFILPLSITGQMLISVLRVDGRTREAARIMILAAVVATAFFVLSTFVLGLGAAGIGIYMGGCIGMYFVSIRYFLAGRSDLSIRLPDVRVRGAELGRIVRVGVPFFLVQGGLFVYNAFVDNILARLGGAEASQAIATFSIVSNYVAYAIFLVARSIAYGMQPVSSYSYGARSWRRLGESLTAAIRIEVVATALVTIAVWVFATPVASLFARGDVALVASSSHALRIAIVAGCLGNLSMITSTYFQSAGRIVRSSVLGLSKNVLFACPVVFLMASAMGVEGVWWGTMLADVGAGCLCLACAWREVRSLDSRS